MCIRDRVYAIQHPFTGEMLYPSNGRCWRYQQSSMLEYMQGWCNYRLENLHDEKERARVCGIDESAVRKDVLAIVLEEPLEVSAAKAQKVYNRGRWPGFYFTKGGYGGIARKTYLENVGGRLPTCLLYTSFAVPVWPSRRHKYACPEAIVPHCLPSLSVSI